MNSSIETHLHEERHFAPSMEFQRSALISSVAQFQEDYRRSIEEPDAFWSHQASTLLDWFRPWRKVCEWDFESIGTKAAPYVKYFEGGELNACFNCLDRHVQAGRGENVAILWQGENDSEVRRFTYRELLREVDRFAWGLRELGVTPGTMVSIFLPMIPEATIAMLACARLGAIHSVVFSAFSSEALKSRILDGESRFVITADVGYHGGKTIALKEKVDAAVASCPSVKHVVTLRRCDDEIAWSESRDRSWAEVVANCPEPVHPSAVIVDAVSMESESPLFTLYTSGSTGKPKGVLHTTAGYLLHAMLTSKYVFDLQSGDVFWCTADIGWITGHSYVVYGPLANGAQVFMYEGIPTYPTAGRFWELIDRYQVSVFYTAPTALRALMRLGEEIPNSYSLASLRLLGSVGEPINPEAWVWYHRVIGKRRCPVIDTWWQTETGGMMITTLPGAHTAKPGSAGRPLWGVSAEVVDSEGNILPPNEGGSLVITRPWPGMIRGVWGDKKNELIKNVYFTTYPGKYFTGDGCRVDEEGYYWLLGRIDDVINVSAHRFATAEIESALVAHQAVAEAAVVGVPHETKGQAIYCFVTLNAADSPSEELRKDLIRHVRTAIGPIATPEVIHFALALPKTRSGKIMRRILRKIAEGEIGSIGDTSTLADPSVVDQLIASRPK